MVKQGYRKLLFSSSFGIDLSSSCMATLLVAQSEISMKEKDLRNPFESLVVRQLRFRVEKQAALPT